METVPSWPFATHTRSSPNAIPVGPLPTGIAWTASLAASTRMTASPSLLVTQTASAPNTTWSGGCGSSIRLDHAAGSGVDAADGPVGGGHPGRPAVTGDGQPGRWVGQPDRRADLVGERVDAGQQPSVLSPAHDPHGVR